MSQVTLSPAATQYWVGNAAKVKIIAEISKRANELPNRTFVVFDYGCGTAHGWPRVLQDHPNLRLIGFEPSPASLAKARELLSGFPAQFLSDSELQKSDFKADFIVSFSVLEHVYDRQFYFKIAKNRLAQDGVFYLNYDDGHFRPALDLARFRSWPSQLLLWCQNTFASLWPLLGRQAYYQKRVTRADLDQFLRTFEFETTDSFYSNMLSLKDLFKTLPVELRDDYSRLWVDFEDALNAKFLLYNQTNFLGDPTNLWTCMGSRTVVLKHAKSNRNN